MDASERYEQLIAFLNTHLPSPVQQEELNDGSLMFTGGSPGQVVARLDRASVVIEQYAIRWETPYTPVMRPRLTCQLCGETKPPEWMEDQDICQQCSASVLGSVH
jgi:hypothetical protein